MDNRTILLIPSPDHREALLRVGPCGSRPPTAGRINTFGFDTGKILANNPWITPDDVEWDDPARIGDALVLARGGAVVPEGLDRWWRVGKAQCAYWPYSHPSAWADTIEEVARIEHYGLGETVVLNG